MKPLFDSHNHLQDEFFAPSLQNILGDMDKAGIGQSLVNGTSEKDWPVVAELTRKYPKQIIPSFGLHPWYIADRSSNWLKSLEGFLATTPKAGIGECGLDRWVEGHDLEEQRKVLIPQIEIATRDNRPLTLHCLRAWGALLEILQSVKLPERGFLLHAYGGTEELVEPFAKIGAYFSFSGYFLHTRKEKQRDVFRSIPKDRLLIETDAPAMSLPTEKQTHRFESDASKNHPANLRVTFRHLCYLLEMAEENTRAQLDKNETTFFFAQE